MRTWKKLVLGTGITLGVGLVGIQLVPYGRDHTNPPVVAEPTWNHAVTRELAKRACFDCHSNETRWPWYSHVAPASWLLQDHVDEGREVLNFSDWPRVSEEADEAAEVILEGEMPPRSYVWLHPEAKLTAEEKRLLADGLSATLGTGPEARAEHDAE